MCNRSIVRACIILPSMQAVSVTWMRRHKLQTVLMSNVLSFQPELSQVQHVCTVYLLSKSEKCLLSIESINQIF